MKRVTKAELARLRALEAESSGVVMIDYGIGTRASIQTTTRIASLMVALHEYAPALLDAAERLERAEELLREELDLYDGVGIQAIALHDRMRAFLAGGREAPARG